MPFDPVTAALDIGSKIIDKIWPDPAQAAQAKLALLQLQQSGDLAQIAVNSAEAVNPSVLSKKLCPFFTLVLFVMPLSRVK